MVIFVEYYLHLSVKMASSPPSGSRNIHSKPIEDLSWIQKKDVCPTYLKQ